MKTCAILNKGSSAWAFQALAEKLSHSLWLEISETPADYNYVLGWDGDNLDSCGNIFIPFVGIKLASDKRLLANIFNRNNIPIPETYLFDTTQDVTNHLNNSSQEWCLKYPIGCGASGHRMLYTANDIPQKWLKPYVVQKFIRLENPMVFRTYCAGGEIFGWNVRKFPKDREKLPWVAHARGAVYEILDSPPQEVVKIATKAFQVTNLFHSFGCIDLIRDENGNWLVLEVGTDGIFSYVDRELGNCTLEQEINTKIAKAFWDLFYSPKYASRTSEFV